MMQVIENYSQHFTGLKIQCWQQRVGSSPTFGTKFKNSFRVFGPEAIFVYMRKTV